MNIIFNGTNVEALKDITPVVTVTEANCTLNYNGIIVKTEPLASTSMTAAFKAKVANFAQTIKLGDLLGINDSITTTGLTSVELETLILFKGGVINFRVDSNFFRKIFWLDLEESGEAIKSLSTNFKNSMAIDAANSKYKFRRFNISAISSIVGAGYEDPSFVCVKYKKEFISAMLGMHQERFSYENANNVAIAELATYKDGRKLTFDDGIIEYKDVLSGPDVDLLNEQVSSLTIENQNFEDANESLTLQVGTLEADLADAQTRLADLGNDYEKLEGDLNESQSTSGMLQLVIDEFINDNSEVSNDSGLSSDAAITLEDIKDLVLANKLVVNDTNTSIKGSMKEQLELIPTLLEDIKQLSTNISCDTGTSVSIKNEKSQNVWYGVGGFTLGMLLRR